MQSTSQPDKSLPETGMFCRGRLITNEDLAVIRATVAGLWPLGRSAISRKVCEALRWLQPNGWLKDRACRDILLHLEKAGYIVLPRRLSTGRRKNDGKPASARFDLDFPWQEEQPTLTMFFRPRIVMVRKTKAEAVWNALVAQYHYLGYNTIVGRHLKFIAYDGDTPVACLGWGDAARAVKCRDQWIGWSTAARECNRQLIVNNVRFLILPWVTVPNLASAILAASTAQLPREWEQFYGVTPVLLETFVDAARFHGTTYKAANWTCVGTTEGKGKRGDGYYAHGNQKLVFAHPLARRFRTRLCDVETPRRPMITSRRQTAVLDPDCDRPISRQLSLVDFAAQSDA